MLDGTKRAGKMHRVHYHVGSEARETDATAAAVEAFYE